MLGPETHDNGVVDDHPERAARRQKYGGAARNRSRAPVALGTAGCPGTRSTVVNFKVLAPEINSALMSFRPTINDLPTKFQYFCEHHLVGADRPGRPPGTGHEANKS
jgi:hypothetical protein